MTSEKKLTSTPSSLAEIAQQQLKASYQKESTKARAWLVPYSESDFFALPLKACQELIDKPAILPVPGMNRYSLGLLKWRDQWLSLIDIQSLVMGKSAQHTSSSQYIIVAYRDSVGQIDYGAIALPSYPYIVEVDDSQLCALPPATATFDWQRVASSCFRHLNHRVPIVDGRLLLGQRHP